jgi:CheY-like chemotaxis protein
MIVDDDPHICEIVQAYCERDGFISACSHTGEDAMKLLASFEPDLIVLDVLLANDNGIDWCRNARSYTNAPIVFLSSHEEDEVKITIRRPSVWGVTRSLENFSGDRVFLDISQYISSISFDSNRMTHAPYPSKVIIVEKSYRFSAKMEISINRYEYSYRIVIFRMLFEFSI